MSDLRATLPDLSLLFALKIFLPTYDIYSDCYLAWRTFSDPDNGDKVLGLLICTPIIFCTIMTAIACCYEESGSVWKKMALLLLVVLQLYSQYRALRVALIGLGLWPVDKVSISNLINILNNFKSKRFRDYRKSAENQLRKDSSFYLH